MSSAVLNPAAPRERVAPLRVLTRIVVDGLVLWAVLDLVGIVSDVSYHGLLQQAIVGNASLSDAQSADNRQHLIGLAQVALFLATSVVFIVWFHRAYANLARLGISQLRWSTRWAVGGWFVPLLSLVRPKAMADDIWRGSDPGLPAESPLPSGPVPWFYRCWWVAFIGGSFLSRIAFQRADSANTISALDSANALLLFTDALDLVAATLAVMFIHQTARRQGARAHALATGILTAVRHPLERTWNA